MKKLMFVLMLIATSATAQIEIKENKTKAVDVGKYKFSALNYGKLSYYINEIDTSIAIMCLNQKYQSLQQYSSLTFKGGAKEKDQLYNALMSCYSDENKDNKDYLLNIKLGTTDVSVYKLWKNVIMTFDNTMFEFSKSNVVSLFGKKETK